jgi:D-alanyl-D-alanine carboxypeptidase
MMDEHRARPRLLYMTDLLASLRRTPPAPRGWRGFVTLAAVAGVCVCAGCGGSGQARTTPTPTPTPTPAPADRPAPSVAVAPLRRALDRALRRGARSAAASAAEGAVAVRSQGVWSGTAGTARGPDAVFSLASITKPFVATLTLRRAQQGRLSLGDTVEHWLGAKVAPEVGQARINQLLGHTSGLTDYLADPAVQRAIQDPRHRWTETELLHAIHRGSRPGVYRYSNSDYILLGAILRRTGGRATGVQLRDEILRPLQLTHTSLDREPALARRFAGGGRQQNDHWGELFSDGGMAGTAREVTRFFDALLVGRTLLRPTLLARMLVPGPNRSYGLGLARASLGRCRVWGHTGFYTGWTTAAVTQQQTGVTITVLLRGSHKGGASQTLVALAHALRSHHVLPC